MNISSYPTVFALGHKAIEDIFQSPVIVQEKIDGSQLSFGVLEGELQCRSKSAVQHIDAPDKLFSPALDTIKGIRDSLVPGYVYRCEYLRVPQHNTLKYARIPRGHLILFDVSWGIENYKDPWELGSIADGLGIEAVPILHQGLVSGVSELEEWLKTESVLGGTPVEGVVIKNYKYITTEKKIAIGKYVREDFKEQNLANWRQMNPTQGDILVRLIDRYKTEARWRKAIQHLRDAGELEGDPRDLARLIPEVKADILKEEKEAIRDELFDFFWPKIERAVVSGFPEFYKRYLAERAFK